MHKRSGSTMIETDSHGYNSLIFKTVLDLVVLRPKKNTDPRKRRDLKHRFIIRKAPWYIRTLRAHKKK